ncbi:DUF6221 family protein [Streptomyces griseoincarnatus]
MDELVQWLRAQLDEDERIARAASGATVEGEPGSWHPSSHGDEWEPLRGEDGDEELLVALRPGLPRPPEVMTGYWGAVFSHQPDAADLDADSPMPSFEHAARHDPARVLREVAAKRQIIERCTRVQGLLLDDFSAERLVDDVLALLALAYAGRPGYREEWRP